MSEERVNRITAQSNKKLTIVIEYPMDMEFKTFRYEVSTLFRGIIKKFRKGKL